MPRDSEKIFRELAARLSAFSLEDYLLSEHFARFCREHGLDDVWKEYLEISRDRPDLYGNAVTKNAFVLFLNHIFHNRPDEFPALFARLLAGLSPAASRKLPGDLKKNLMNELAKMMLERRPDKEKEIVTDGKTGKLTFPDR